MNLVALLFNLFLLNYVKDSKALIWQLFFVFVIGHLFFNYKAVKSVIIQTFNKNRFHILVQEYLSTSKIMVPYHVNKSEPVLATVSRYFSNLKLGCCIDNFNSLNENQLEILSNENFLINFDINSRFIYLFK